MITMVKTAIYHISYQSSDGDWEEEECAQNGDGIVGDSAILVTSSFSSHRDLFQALLDELAIVSAFTGESIQHGFRG